VLCCAVVRWWCCGVLCCAAVALQNRIWGAIATELLQSVGLRLSPRNLSRRYSEWRNRPYTATDLPLPVVTPPRSLLVAAIELDGPNSPDWEDASRRIEWTNMLVNKIRTELKVLSVAPYWLSLTTACTVLCAVPLSACALAVCCELCCSRPFAP
jgi:hypothetical protein